MSLAFWVDSHHSSDMLPRRLIIQDGTFCHAFFRCHNRSNLFEERAIKLEYLLLLARYAKKYGVKVIEFIPMENHVHLILQPETVARLGDFMRVVNSQIATKINKFYDRDSQAIRERYKTVLIGDAKHMRAAMQYLWMNRFKVNGLRPELDPFCSASWRLSGGKIIRRLTQDEKKIRLLEKLLCDYSDLPIEIGIPLNRVGSWIRWMIEEALGKIKDLCWNKKFRSSHTLGDAEQVSYRSELLTAHRRIPKAHPT